jgi:hypothetical protein
MRAFDYFAKTNNDVDNGDKNDYSTPKNNKGISNKIDGSKLSSSENENKYSFNPLIPGTSKEEGWRYEEQTQNGDEKKDDESSDSENSGVFPNPGSGSSDSSKNKGMSLKDYLVNFINSNTDGGQTNTTSFNGQNVNTQSNQSDASPSDKGSDSSASQSKSSKSPDSAGGGESGSVSKKAYEIDEKNEDKFIPSIFFIIPVLILLFVGIRRKKSNLD